MGDNADGIAAQSEGGGGGNGAFSALGVLSTGGVPAGGSWGGKGGAGGDGGTVLVTSVHNIETWGIGSNGIFAESVGGGGAASDDRCQKPWSARAPCSRAADSVSATKVSRQSSSRGR